MEKIAYLITAYKDPVHLKRLINALDYNADFFVHIDRKVDIRLFRKELLSIQREIYCVNKYYIMWGGYSQVLSQKELLHACLSTGEKYLRVVCISGQDYPIFSNRKIREIFEEAPGKEFIAGVNISVMDKKQLYKIVYYNFFDLFSGKYPMLNCILIRVLNRISKLIKFKKRTQALLNEEASDVFFGSDYWAITYDCARYVYKSLCGEKKFLRYMKTAYAPSELCINTIVFNSVFGRNAIHIAKDYDKDVEKHIAFERISPIHYLIYKEKVYPLTENDLDDIINSKKMFFRKAETGVSDKLMELIDELRNESFNKS